MSSHNRLEIDLSGQAQKDLDDILLYTLQTWGADQQRMYADVLDKALIRLAEDPRKGKRHPKLNAEFRYYYAGRHNIVYRVVGTELKVVRILHDKMDMTRHIR